MAQKILKKPSTRKKIENASISLNIIQSCNLSCSYCFANQGDYGKPSVMTEEIAKKSIDFFLKKYKNLHVHFFGGEPLLNTKLIKKIINWSKCYEKRISFSLTTNGTLLDESKINYFKENAVSLKVSYDGKTTQNRNRGSVKSNTLNDLVIKKLEKYQDSLKKIPYFHIRSTCLIKEYKSIEPLMEEMSEKFKFAVAYVKDAGENDKNQVIKTIKGLKSIFLQYILYCKSLKKIELSLEILNIASLVDLIKKHEIRKSFCAAGISYFSISTSGSIYLCHRFNENNKMKLGDIYDGISREKVEEFEVYRSNSSEPCRSCWVKNLCRGGCLYEHGASFSKDYFFCKLQKMEVEIALFYIKNAM